MPFASLVLNDPNLPLTAFNYVALCCQLVFSVCQWKSNSYSRALFSLGNIVFGLKAQVYDKMLAVFLYSFGQIFFFKSMSAENSTFAFFNILKFVFDKQDFKLGY